MPEEKDANLILIGTGTGIAPVPRVRQAPLLGREADWEGNVMALSTAPSSGLELLYMNEQNNDLANYYDRETFEAFKALSPRPHWADPIAWDQAITERGEELWNMLSATRRPTSTSPASSRCARSSNAGVLQAGGQRRRNGPAARPS